MYVAHFQKWRVTWRALTNCGNQVKSFRNYRSLLTCLAVEFSRGKASDRVQAVGGHHLEPADIDDILIGPDA